MTELDSTHPSTNPAQKAFENVNAGRDIKADIRQESNVRIEESAVGSAIVSGDGNTIYVIHQTTEQRRESIQTDTAVSIGPNPYKGLAAFNENDADHYFGREGQVKRLWQRFWDLVEQSGRADAVPRFLPILGPSGCGKSSLARAGFIPELARSPLPGKDRMRVAVLVPGTHPVEALAGVLAKVATQDPMPVTKTREFTTELNLPTAAGLYDGMRRIADLMPQIKDSPLVVLVDQFEEIYSLCEDTNERQAFIENLLCAASDPTGNLSVMITLRSDFLEETQRHPMLNQVIGSDKSMIVPAMTEAELRRAIAEPAKQAGHPLDEAMVDLLVKDTEGREGALPLLQFALTRIWEGLGEGTPPATTYRQMGGVGGALAGKAQEIYDKLPKVEKDIARRIFIGLVQLGEGTRDTRRRAAIENLMTSQDRPETLQQVLDRFSSPGARLITLSSQANQEIAEVTHEALIRHWRLLQQWIEGNRDLLRLQRRIEASTVIWQENQKSKGYLLQGRALKEAKVFLKRHSHDFPVSSTTEKFIKTSTRQQQLSCLKWASLLLIPFLILESFLHEEYINRNYARLSSNNSSERRQAVLSLTSGCKSTVPMQKRLSLLPYKERLYGNCRSLANQEVLREINLRDVDLSYADLSYSNLQYADLSYANLTNANLEGSSLSDAKLNSANLTDAQLGSVNLFFADLESANLQNANLEGALFVRTKLSAATVTNANLGNAIFLSTDLRTLEKLGETKVEDSQPVYTCNSPLPTGGIVTWEEKCEVIPKILVDRDWISSPEDAKIFVERHRRKDEL